MSDCIPDRNWLIVESAVENKRVPKDAFLVDVCDVKQGNKSDATIEETLAYIASDYHRDILVAFLLSGMPEDEIAEFLRLDRTVLDQFQLLLVNPVEFRNKLDIFWYAEQYVKNKCGNERGQQVVKAGIQLGPAGLIHQFTHGDEDIRIDTKKITKKMLQVAFVLGQLARGNPVTSAQSKESLKWVGAANQLAKQVEHLGADTSDADEALLAVEERKLARTAEQAGISADDILH
jgi:hypothetical protein